MKKSGQRFHHRRAGSLVSPGVTGLLFTIDPNQTGKAIRELQLYFDRFRDIFPVEEEVCEGEGSDSGSDDVEDSEGTCVPTPLPTPASSLAAQLAAELDEFRTTGPTSNDGTVTKRVKKPVVPAKTKLYGILDTNCKGYIFVNVPSKDILTSQLGQLSTNKKRAREEEEGGEQVIAKPIDVVESVDTAVEATEGEKKAEKATGGRQFQVNQRVATLVDAVFDELSLHPQRPIVRFTYRMFPCNISCYPVENSMVDAAMQLSKTIPMIAGRSAIKLGVWFSIKNNSRAEQDKGKLKAAIESCLPRDRFLVLPIGHRGISLDGVLEVMILHSTCCMGYAPSYTERREYNLHRFGHDNDTAATIAEEGVTK